MKKKILIPIIAGALIVIGVVIFFIIRSKDPSYFNIKIMDKTGTVNIDRDGSSLDVYEDLKIRDKDYLKVGFDGFTRIDCDRSTFSHFEHDTEASFVADSDKKLTINLIKGEMVVELQKTFSNEEQLNVKTPNTAMAIRGTVVAVKVIPEADGGVKTINYCLEGKADIETADGTTETIEAGEGWLVVSDENGNITESKASGVEEFEFTGIDIGSLKGADENEMVLNYSDGNPVNRNLPATMSGEDVVIDGINFPDLIFRLYIINKIDFNGDWVLSPYELGEVSIDVSSSGIKDLKGIEFFKDLLTLNCQSNELTSLDLSQNTKLLNLYCSNNQLKSLDISKCGKLNFINCENNKLKELDVSNALELKSLDCGHNSILDLDITNNKELNRLDCNSNPLTTLDVSKNTSLVYLYCYSDQLKRLDVSSNTELECLYAGENQLTNIDVSHNTELKEFSCYNCMLSELDVSNNKKLTLLMCGLNAYDFRSLDVSNNTELVQLEFPSNKISEIDLSKNTKLERLNCMFNELTELDLSNNPLIQDEHLYYDSGKVKIIR